jgi:hypothetical protein
MTKFKEWLDNLKLTNPKIKDSVEKLEKYFTAEGFDAQEFESILNKGLKSIEQSVPKRMNQEINANN